MLETEINLNCFYQEVRARESKTLLVKEDLLVYPAGAHARVEGVNSNTVVM